MPKIVRFHEIGGPENLQFEEVPPQQPGKGEVRLRVLASGLNRAESLFYRGIYLEKPQVPSRLGYEVAGVVEAVGEDVDPGWVGKNVSTVPGFSQNRYGTLGEQAIVPASALGQYPQISVLFRLRPSGCNTLRPTVHWYITAPLDLRILFQFQPLLQVLV